MELEKINAIRKRAIKEPRQLDIHHGLNKTTSINYSASILCVLKKDMHVFTGNNLVFKEHEELGVGVFGVVRLGFIRSIQLRVAVKIFSENSAKLVF